MLEFVLSSVSKNCLELEETVKGYGRSWVDQGWVLAEDMRLSCARHSWEFETLCLFGFSHFFIGFILMKK